MNNDSKKIPTLKNNIYMIRMIWSASPLRVFLSFLMTLLSFASWTFYTVFFMKYLFGSKEGRTFNEVILFVWIVVFINLIYHYLSSWYNRVYVPISDIKIRYEINKILFEKAQSVDISCFENPDFYDSYTRANTEACDRAMSVLRTCTTLLSASLSSIYVIYTMTSITFWSLIFVALPLIGNLYFGKKLGKLRYDLNNECVKHKRKQDYVNRIIYLRKYAGEIRKTNIVDILKDIYEKAINNILDINKKYAKRRFVNLISMSMLQFPLAFQGMWFVGAYLAIVTKTITLGGFIVLSSSIVSITWMLRNFTDALNNYYIDANYIENLKHYLNYTPKIDELQKGLIPNPEINDIEFKDVSFKYSGQLNYALHHVSLKISRGTKNAIVGVNGSGKSTFLKLLMRLYDPIDGVILLNNIDIRNYDLKAYRGLIGTAFQDFAIFSQTVLENVLMRTPIDETDRLAGIKAMEDSDIYEKFNSFENGVDSILTKEFDKNGIELSGGEKQKLAIARAFAKKTPIVILDEPSSALDPIAEYNMYNNIIKVCNDMPGKIALIVSHRLSSSMMCDNIFMFESGTIIERGSHEDLMNKSGAYKEMFDKQAASYLQKV